MFSRTFNLFIFKRCFQVLLNYKTTRQDQECSRRKRKHQQEIFGGDDSDDEDSWLPPLSTSPQAVQ